MGGWLPRQGSCQFKGILLQFSVTVRKENPGIGRWWVGSRLLVTGLDHRPNHTCAVVGRPDPCLPAGCPACSQLDQLLQAQQVTWLWLCALAVLSSGLSPPLVLPPNTSWPLLLLLTAFWNHSFPSAFLNLGASFLEWPKNAGELTSSFPAALADD